jgi:Family of unknown function (DUF6221)
MPLIEWVREQLDADEANARDRWAGVHRADCDQNDYGPDNSGVCDCGEPERRLAEVKAKRAVLELHSHVTGYPNDIDRRCALDHDYDPCRTLRLLAQPIAGRDGWQDEWSVGE